MEVTPTPTGRTLKLADGTRYEFNGPGLLTAVIDPAGNRITFGIDVNNLPTTLTDAAGKVYNFSFTTISGFPVLTRITDPAGRFVAFEYDSSSRMIRYTD